MKFIEPSVEIIQQEPGIDGMMKIIEMAGRTAYKSEDHITEDSAKRFVKMLKDKKHGAALEHGTCYLDIPKEVWNDLVDDHDLNFIDCPYQWFGYSGLTDDYIHLTTNYRVLVEHGYESLLDGMVEPLEEDFENEIFKRRITVKFTCDRGVSHELVRHRKLSFMQESSRYCNYSKDKFGNEITYIIPYWSKLTPGVYKDKRTPNTKDDILINSCIDAESNYLELINFGCNPGEARQVLTNALKTEVCVTGFLSDWRYFFSLRYFGTTGNPHPDIQKLASDLYIQFKQNNYIQ
jgi:thymidylate synthase (FAD)